MILFDHEKRFCSCFCRFCGYDRDRCFCRCGRSGDFSGGAMALAPFGGYRSAGGHEISGHHLRRTQRPRTDDRHHRRHGGEAHTVRHRQYDAAAELFGRQFRLGLRYGDGFFERRPAGGETDGVQLPRAQQCLRLLQRAGGRQARTSPVRVFPSRRQRDSGRRAGHGAEEVRQGVVSRARRQG